MAPLSWPRIMAGGPVVVRVGLFTFGRKARSPPAAAPSATDEICHRTLSVSSGFKSRFMLPPTLAEHQKFIASSRLLRRCRAAASMLARCEGCDCEAGSVRTALTNFE